MAVLVLVGSGETSPTMVTAHREVVSRLGARHPRAVVLATPYAFQENAAHVSARAARYFTDSVGLRVRIVTGTSRDAGPEVAPAMTGEQGKGPGTEAREAAEVRAADWVFSGPGSPSYALAHWRAGPVAAALRDRVLAGDGVTVLASAAAATAGRFTVPVYEIYKAGAAPRWLTGLDLLGGFGLPVAVIPHYDNAEGGRYDTRRCYLGERRLAVMERELPGDAAVLGTDEHTALLIDLRAGQVAVRGRGGVTVRRSGASVVLPAGARLTLSELRDLVRGTRRARVTRFEAEPARGDAEAAAGATKALPLAEVMAAAERRFGVAAGERNADAMAREILELETAIGQWEADTDEDQGTDQARTLLRSLIGRLGRAARDGLADPAGPLAAGGRAAPDAADRAARPGELRRRRCDQAGAGRRRA